MASLSSTAALLFTNARTALTRPSDALDIVFNDIHISEVGGHVVFRPPRAVGTLVHFHGYGGLSVDELKFLWKLAQGEFGDPVTVIAPVARKVVPRTSRMTNLHTTLNIIQFMRSHALEASDLRAQLIRSMAGENTKIISRLVTLINTINAPASWYPFIVKKISQQGQSSVLIPDFEVMTNLAFRTAETIAPLTHQLLREIGVGKTCVFGFSQGVGMAIAHAASAPDLFCHLVLTSLPCIKTATLPDLRPIGFKVDVILPQDDPLPEIFGLTRETIDQSLEEIFAGRATVWAHCPGGHTVGENVAAFAGKRIVEALNS